MTRRKHLWPLFLLPVAAVLAFVWLGPPRGGARDNAGPGGAGNGPKVADLGGRARELPAANAPANADEAETPPGPEPEGGEPPVEEASNTAREIDIYLGQLAHATRVNNQRGQTLAHESLKKCRPSELVDERVLAALESETGAPVRAQFFAAFHAEDARLAWATRALELRAGKFLGTDENYQPGETDELALLARCFLRAGRDPDLPAPVLAFVRSTLQQERPDWALKVVIARLAPADRARPAGEPAYAPPDALCKAFELELRQLLERATAPLELREQAFVAWLLTFTTTDDLFRALEIPALLPCLATMLDLCNTPRDKGWRAAGWLAFATSDPEALRRAVGNVLAGSADTAAKQRLIQRLGLAAAFEHRRALLEAGLQRKDANQGDYLAAWGHVAASEADLKLLSEAAESADAAVASGAIQGLTACGYPLHTAAGAELRRLVEQGKNPGLQSQALGAVLAGLPNQAEKEKLVDKYLAPEFDATVRAVAVSHILATNTERMKQVGEADPSPRVRQAALTRLGDMKDKKLRPYFLNLANNDPQPLIRQQARKYADELKDD